MLQSNRKGYAVMTKELDFYSFEDESLEACKRWCMSGYVIVELIPYVMGYSVRVVWHKFAAPFYFKYSYKNIFWLHWSVEKVYVHRKGDIVYRNEE